jgi:magnesium chelatase family protein
LDRIDLHVEVTPVSYDDLSDFHFRSESSEEIAKRVTRARNIQDQRFKDYPGIFYNAQMPGKMVREVCQLTPAGVTLLKTAMTKMQLSARAYDRILKVARTAADLAGSEDIKIEHLAEAIQYRNLDREGWAG